MGLACRDDISVLARICELRVRIAHARENPMSERTPPASVRRRNRCVIMIRMLTLLACGCGPMTLGAGFAAAQGQVQSEASDTSEEAISKLEKSLTRSRWNVGNGQWQQFLPDMKTTNKARRTGNWVVTDDRTIITGGRGAQGALYVWKFDSRRREATISRYDRDEKYERAASRTSKRADSGKDRSVAQLRELVTDSKWDLGDGHWQQFLAEMKTTNEQNRTGNWVATDGNTALTGGRGTQGAIYIWKFDEMLNNAVITKYVRDPKYARSARRIR